MKSNQIKSKKIWKMDFSLLLFLGWLFWCVVVVVGRCCTRRKQITLGERERMNEWKKSQFDDIICQSKKHTHKHKHTYEFTKKRQIAIDEMMMVSFDVVVDDWKQN